MKSKIGLKRYANMLQTNFLDIHRRFILYKHDDFKDKILSNNNLSETKIGWSASKFEKKKI